MGSKRIYDGEEPMQLPYKYSKQSATGEKLNSYANEKLAPIVSVLEYKSNDDLSYPVGLIDFKVPQVVDPYVDKNINSVQTVVDKGPEYRLHLPWIGDWHDDEARGWSRGSHLPLSQEYFEFSSFKKAHLHVDDALSSFLDRYPRKPIPIGANHQAELPEWVPPKLDCRSSLAPNPDQGFISNKEERFMGLCVILMPDSLPAPNNLPVRDGRKHGNCVDEGSVRCVKQHVKEARDELLKVLGEDKFWELGFLDMGEVVALRWTQEEEQIFHDIVFSNPSSLGVDFWTGLSEEFPTRSTRDFVSYYFNVFVLRKRAAQNRSPFLDIDSDDDEWHPGYGGSYPIGFQSELLVHDEDSSDEDDNNSDTDDDTCSEGTAKKEDSQPSMGYFQKDSDFVPGNHDDSCLSFEFQSAIDGSTPAENSAVRKCIGGSNNDKYDHGSVDDASNFRQWDHGFSASLDHIIPTQNMIEEIHGPVSGDNKFNHD